jgi:hypothetical protein
MNKKNQEEIIDGIVKILKNEWYDWLYENEPGFKYLGMDQQGEYIECIVDYIIKYELNVPIGTAPSERK